MNRETNFIGLANRLVWVDWMKVIGIYLIVAGHFFPPYDTFIYVFSVPVFFLISGFLCKKEESIKTFFSKIWKNLMLPCYLFCLINVLVYIGFTFINSNYTLDRVLPYLLSILYGKTGGGIGGCWFIMALALIKIIFQFFPRKILSWIVLPVCMVLHLYLGMNGFKSNNAYLNACGGFFFFMVGVWLQSRSCLSKKISTPYFLIGLILATAITLFVAIWNGKPRMHHNSWGNYYILFILGGLSGSVIVYLLSNRLSKWNSKALQLLSSGTIVILGLHMHFIRLYQIVIPIPSSIWDYLTAYLLLLLFIPIIQLIKNYFPVLMGKRLK